MFNGQKVISTCPAGRRRYLAILAPYLLRQKHIIDEHHWWINTEDEADIRFLEKLHYDNPDFFKLIRFPSESGARPCGSLTVYKFFDAKYCQRDVLYLRFDDDICYISHDAVEQLLAFRLAHPEFFLVFANIINNGIQDGLRQRMGLIDFAPFLCSLKGNSHGSGVYAEASHWSFLRRHRDGRLGEYKKMFYKWILAYRERVSINCFAWLGQDMGLVNVPEQDEHYLTKVATKELKRVNAICGGALVSHFAFATQRNYLEKTELLDHYKTLALGGVLPEQCGGEDVFSVKDMRICFFTTDRSKKGKRNYIHESISNFARAISSSSINHANQDVVVDLIIDGDRTDWIGDLGIPTRSHPIEGNLWREMERWNVHRRISYSYQRCFALALSNPDCPGVLICEDDVDFRDGFLDKLRSVLDEIFADGKRWFTLSLYTVGNLDSHVELDAGNLYGIYPEWLFWGGQAVFFSRDCLQEAEKFWKARGWGSVDGAEDANDRLVGRFGHSLWRQFGESGGHYRAYRDLVQHTGEVTTGMSHFYHFSDTFSMPWPGEETATDPQGVRGHPNHLDIEFIVNPENVALPDVSAMYVPISGNGCENILRAFGRWLRVSVGGFSDVSRAAFPSFTKSLPDGWWQFTFVRNPLDRLLMCYQQNFCGDSIHPPFRTGDSFSNGMDFPSFVAAVESIPDDMRHAGLRTQSAILKPHDLSFVGRYETGIQDFRKICKLIGLGELWIPPFGEARLKSTNEFFDEDTLASARRIYAVDFDLLHYTPIPNGSFSDGLSI